MLIPVAHVTACVEANQSGEECLNQLIASKGDVPAARSAFPAAVRLLVDMGRVELDDSTWNPPPADPESSEPEGT